MIYWKYFKTITEKEQAILALKIKSCDQLDTGYKFRSKEAQSSSFLMVMTLIR